MIEYLKSDLGMQFMLLAVPMAGINIDIGTWVLFRAKHAIQCAPNLFRTTIEHIVAIHRLSHGQMGNNLIVLIPGQVSNLARTEQKAYVSSR